MLSNYFVLGDGMLIILEELFESFEACIFFPEFENIYFCSSSPV